MYSASVIIPVLSQKSEWLRQSVVSAVMQTEPTEVIVVASPRTPESNTMLLGELSESHHNLEVLTQPQGTGYARAFNVGIEHSSTGRVGFLLSDDWLDDCAVSSCLDIDVDIVSTGLTMYDAQGVNQVGQRWRKISEFLALPSIERKAAYLKHFLLLRKDRLIEVGGVDETIGRVGPDDYDLIWTLLEHGATACVTERPCYNYRDHFEERLTLRKREDQVRDLEKILDKHGVVGEERKNAIDRQARWYGAPLHVSAKLLADPSEAALS